MKKNLDWFFTILLGFITVYLGTAYYGFIVLKPLLIPQYGNEIYTYGYGSFFTLIHISFLIPSLFCALACRLLLKLSNSYIKVATIGFVIFFVGNIYACHNILWPNYASDFGNTWTTPEIIIELILGMDYVLPFFIMISLLGGILLGLTRNITIKCSR